MFKGVSATTVILTPGACGLGLRAALLATISAAPVAVFQTASFCAQASHLRALDPPRIGSRELRRYSEPLGGLWETLGDFRSIFGCGKTLGGLFWLRKNPGRSIWAAEKPWARYFGCGKTWAGAILAAEKPCARAHSGNLPHKLCIFDT